MDRISRLKGGHRLPALFLKRLARLRRWNAIVGKFRLVSGVITSIGPPRQVFPCFLMMATPGCASSSCDRRWGFPEPCRAEIFPESSSAPGAGLVILQCDLLANVDFAATSSGGQSVTGMGQRCHWPGDILADRGEIFLAMKPTSGENAPMAIISRSNASRVERVMAVSVRPLAVHPGPPGLQGRDSQFSAVGGDQWHIDSNSLRKGSDEDSGFWQSEQGESCLRGTYPPESPPMNQRARSGLNSCCRWGIACWGFGGCGQPDMQFRDRVWV